MNSRKTNNLFSSRSWLIGLLLLGTSLPNSAQAQMGDEFSETEVQQIGEVRPEVERTRARDELESGPRASARWFEEVMAFESVERMDAAINRLEGLVNRCRGDDCPNLMFRLAELYYTKARYFEQRAYDRRDQAHFMRETNPAQADHYERSASDDIQQSDRFATQAITVYADLYQNFHDSYDGMDAVLYYLGSTLSQLGRTEDALDFFQELANDYPNSPFMPQALLAFGEYYFQLGDMEQAQLFYHAVTEFPGTAIYSYAMYQEAWCFYNTGNFRQAIQRMLDTIEAAAGEGTGATRMRNMALNNLATFYVEVGTAANAFDFFNAIAPDDAFRLTEYVARIFSEDGNYHEGNALFRELMGRNRDSFRIVVYQEEIVNNTLPTQNEQQIVTEVRRLVELFNAAKQFPAATEQEVNEAADRIEYLVRRLATTFHRDAQVLRNEVQYALAYNLYEDYVTSMRQYATPETGYTMTFYFAELLYRNERYEEAAFRWEECLEVNPDGEHNEEAIYKTVLAYVHLFDPNAPPPVIEAPQECDESDTECRPGIPRPLELPPLMQRMRAAGERYLELNPPPEFAVEVEYVIARILYDYAHLDECVERFGRIALNYFDVDPDRARISAELLLDSLGALQDYGRMEEWVNLLRASPLNRGDFAPRLNELGQTISFGQCHGTMMEGRYHDCGMCFFEFFRNYHDSPVVDRALYNAAQCFENNNELARAIRVREVLMQYRPNSDLIPEVTFTVGRVYHRLALYRNAAESYELYARNYPGQEYSRPALLAAAAFRQGLGEYDHAISIYEQFIRLYRRDHPEDAGEAFFQIGMIFVERNQRREANDHFREYLNRWVRIGPPGRAIEAATYVGKYMWGGRRDRAESFFGQAMDLWNGLSDEARSTLHPSSRDAAAEARFMLGEGVFEQYSQIVLEGNERQVQDRLERKIALGAQAGQVYEQVRAFGRPGWTIAAFARLGMLYHDLYESINNAPVPSFDSFAVEEAYRAQIEEQTASMRELAIEYYTEALNIAQAAGWFNEYSAAAERNLAQVDLSFRASSEIRVSPGYHTPPLAYSDEFYLSVAVEEEVPIEEEGIPGSGEEQEEDLSPGGEANSGRGSELVSEVTR